MVAGAVILVVLAVPIILVVGCGVLLVTLTSRRSRAVNRAQNLQPNQIVGINVGQLNHGISTVSLSSIRLPNVAEGDLDDPNLVNNLVASNSLYSEFGIPNHELDLVSQQQATEIVLSQVSEDDDDQVPSEYATFTPAWHYDNNWANHAPKDGPSAAQTTKPTEDAKHIEDLMEKPDWNLDIQELPNKKPEPEYSEPDEKPAPKPTSSQTTKPTKDAKPFEDPLETPNQNLDAQALPNKKPEAQSNEPDEMPTSKPTSNQTTKPTKDAKPFEDPMESPDENLAIQELPNKEPEDQSNDSGDKPISMLPLKPFNWPSSIWDKPSKPNYEVPSNRPTPRTTKRPFKFTWQSFGTGSLGNTPNGSKASSINPSASSGSTKKPMQYIIKKSTAPPLPANPSIVDLAVAMVPTYIIQPAGKEANIRTISE